MFPIAIGAINLPICGWRGAGAIHHVTVAGWAHVGKLRKELVDVIEEWSIVFAEIDFVAIKRYPTLLYFGRTFRGIKRVIKKKGLWGKLTLHKVFGPTNCPRSSAPARASWCLCEM